jgi:hypothetical protein
MESLNKCRHAMEDISLQRNKEHVIKGLQAKCFDIKFVNNIL